MSLPTAADLIERLREVYSENGRKISYEDLVPHIPITGSTVSRWKKETPKNVFQIFQMLDAAGWLNQDEASEVTTEASDDVPAVTQPQLSDLLESLDRIEQMLRSRLDEPPTETQSASGP